PHGHRGVDVVQDGRAKKEPLALHVGAAVYQECGSLSNSLVNVVGHPVPVLGTNERTNVHTRLVSWSDNELASLCTQWVQEMLRGVPNGHRDTAGQAPLTRIAEG